MPGYETGRIIVSDPNLISIFYFKYGYNILMSLYGLSFVTSFILIISYVILLIGRKNTRRLLVAVLLSVLLNFMFYLLFNNIHDPKFIIRHYYLGAYYSILNGNIPQGIIDLQQTDKYGSLINYAPYEDGSWKESTIVLPYLSTISDILLSINGGSMKYSDIQTSSSNNELRHVGYLLKFDVMHVIILNMYDNGDVLLYTNINSQTDTTCYAEDDIVRNVISLISNSNESPTAWTIDGSVMFNEIRNSIISGPELGGADIDGQTCQCTIEYINLSCINGNYNSYTNEYGDINHQTQFKSLSDQLLEDTKYIVEHGSIIRPSEYLEKMRVLQDQYRIQSLTDYQWSNIYDQYSNNYTNVNSDTNTIKGD